jgi:hypothetical protein
MMGQRGELIAIILMRNIMDNSNEALKRRIRILELKLTKERNKIEFDFAHGEEELKQAYELDERINKELEWLSLTEEEKNL